MNNKIILSSVLICLILLVGCGKEEEQEIFSLNIVNVESSTGCSDYDNIKVIFNLQLKKRHESVMCRLYDNGKMKSHLNTLWGDGVHSWSATIDSKGFVKNALMIHCNARNQPTKSTEYTYYCQK